MDSKTNLYFFICIYVYFFSKSDRYNIHFYLYSHRYIFYTHNLTFNYVSFFQNSGGWTMWTALPLRRRCASAIVSRYGIAGRELVQLGAKFTMMICTP